MRQSPWPILVAGTITRDDVRTPAGFNRDGLGGSATYTALAARLFAPVHLVATVGPDFEAPFLAAMPAEGIDVRGVAVALEPTYRWIAEHNDGTGATSAETSEQGAYASFTPKLAAHHQQAPIVFLGSMEPRHQLRVLEQLDRPRLVAGDTMRLYIGSQREALHPVLDRLDYLFLNAAEATALARVESPREAAAFLRRRYGLRGFVLKEGARGATLFSDAGEIHAPALPVAHVVDPTGAGDAVAGAFLGALAESQTEDEASLTRALTYGMVLASFCIEHFSVAGLVGLTREQVEARMGAPAGGG